MAYVIFWEENGIYIKHSGIVTYREIFEIEGKLVGDARYETSQYEIINMLEIDGLEVSLNEIVAIGSLERAASRYRRDKYVIMLADREEYMPVIHKYFEILNSVGWETVLLKSLSEAREYITGKLGLYFSDH